MPNMHCPSAKYLHGMGGFLGIVLVHAFDVMGALKKSVVGRSRHQRRHVVGHQVPVRMDCPCLMMVTVVASKAAVQSLSRNCPMEMSEPHVSLAKCGLCMRLQGGSEC